METRRRSPILLWKFLTAELLRLVSLTAAVLVAVIAFAASVKPMTDGLLQAADLLKFVLYAIPPMLSYALPFAGGFAATLVYHRFATDHEAVAAHAGGISHRAVLMPAVGGGIAVCVVLGCLNEWVNPSLLRRLEHMVTRDVAAWIVQEINRGKAVEAGGMSILADSASLVDPGEGSGATDLLILRKFIAIERDKAGLPQTEVTSESGWIWLFPWEGEAEQGGRPQPQSRVVMRLANYIGVAGGQWRGRSDESIELAWAVPNAFRESPKFMRWGELRVLVDRPERITRVDIRRRELAMLAAEHLGMNHLLSTAGESGRIELRDTEGRRIAIETAGMDNVGKGWLLRPGPSGKVLAWLFRRSSEGSVQPAPTELEATGAVLIPSMGDERFNRRYNFRVDFEDVAVTDSTSAGRVTTRRPAYAVTGLAPAADPSTELLSLAAPRLLERVRRDPGLTQPDARLAEAVRDLATAVRTVHRQVLAKRNERIAIPVSAVLMMLTGAVMALRLSRRTPLVVYLFSFLPAVVCVVTVSGGQQATVQSGPAGLVLLWGGVVALAVYVLWNYRILSRH